MPLENPGHSPNPTPKEWTGGGTEIKNMETAKNMNWKAFTVGQTLFIGDLGFIKSENGYGRILSLTQSKSITKATIEFVDAEDGKTYTASIDIDTL